MSQRVSDHLIQGILIFLSVFFAFWLTEYRESQKDSETLQTSLQYISSEVKYNHHRIETIFEYYNNLLTEIDSLRTQSDSKWTELDGSDLAMWKGLQIPLLRSTAYQTYLNSNLIDNVEFELAKSLTRVYDVQSITDRLDNSLVEHAIIASDEITNLPRLRNLLRTYLFNLSEVMTEYQRAQENVLSKYGYDVDINNNELNNEVNRRMKSN